jgi:hypothetical protein
MIIFAGCAEKVNLNYKTPSNKPEALFRDKTVAELKNLILSEFSIKGGKIVGSGENYLTFTSKLQIRDLPEKIGLSVKYGSSALYDDALMTRFLFIQQGQASVRVMVNMTLRLQNDLGDLMEVDDFRAKDFNYLMDFLIGVGGEPLGERIA